MRYLIDSNILIFFSNEEQLTAEVEDILDDHGNRIYVPSKCLEEVIYLSQSRKIKSKRWKTAEGLIDFVVKEMGFGIKSAGEEHLRTLARLPLFPDHKDPTDRIIVAQAITEKTPLISSDRKFHYYVKHGLDFVFNKR